MNNYKLDPCGPVNIIIGEPGNLPQPELPPSLMNIQMLSPEHLSIAVGRSLPFLIM